MKKLKKIAVALAAAALAVFFAPPPLSGSVARAAANDETLYSAYYGSADYSPADSSGYRLWTGAEEFEENASYYIDSIVKVSGGASFTLPETSRLLIRNGGSLLIYTDGAFSLKGELVLEAAGNMTVSGTFTAAQGSKVLNYGTFSGTKSSVMQLSSPFVTGNTGITVFSGEVNVYRSGVLADFNRMTFSEHSVVMLTGKLLCESGGLVFCKGDFSVTMNGNIYSRGSLYLYSNMAVSGNIFLEPASKYYTSGDAKFKFTKSGTITDDRRAAVPEASEAPAEPDVISEPSAVTPSEYDSEPEKVEWKGIDVSRYNGAINWKKVKESGIDFVILRSSIGDGSTDITGEDIRFSYNVVEARKAGLMVGAYHYLWAETVEDAVKEAKFFIKTISPYTLDFPAVLDFEDPSQQLNLTNAERTAIAKAFLSEVKNAGYFPMLYVNRSWATGYLNMDELSEYEVWLAEWFSSPSYTGDFGIWQYTAYGGVSGIEGQVDLDISYKNYRKMILDGGYNHLK